MNKDLLLEHIMSSYNIGNNFSSMRIFQFAQYPHVLKLELLNYSLFVKLIDPAKIYCRDLNELYTSLAKSSSSIEVPILTNNGSYYSQFNSQMVLLYEELKEIQNSPGSKWWSDCLSSIHNIRTNENYRNYYSSDFYNQAINLLNAAKELILPSRIKKINQLLDVVEGNINIKSMVLCHNDPYDLNVMLSKDQYKLIDTDGMGLSPKEFDIQRLLYNHVINSNDLDASLAFWDTFKSNYENNISEKIDVSLLKKLYALDLVRTTSWLYLVCNDLSRTDRERQQEQLDLFERSFDCNSHQKVLQKI